MSQENNDFGGYRRSPEVLGFYKLSNQVVTPTFATEGSAAFDLRAFLDGTAVKAYNRYNDTFLAGVGPDNKLSVLPGCRYMVPTGLILDIPEGYYVTVNIRGGTGLKSGLMLANNTGIVDGDYTQELFVLVSNTSQVIVVLENGERIAQAKLEKVNRTVLLEIPAPPGQKTSRNGGFNSTGKK